MYSIIVIKSTRTCLVVHDDSVKKYRKFRGFTIVSLFILTILLNCNSFYTRFRLSLSGNNDKTTNNNLKLYKIKVLVLVLGLNFLKS